MAEENPFTPGFGEIPVHLAGRGDIIRACIRAFQSERRRPELTTLISGARGTGKTALLSYLAEQAEDNGWIAVGTTALPGLLDDIEVQLKRRAAHLIAPGGPSVREIGIPDIISIELGETQDAPNNWRSRIEDVLDQLTAQNIGVLFTIDEIDPTLDEMIQLAAIYQHFVRENRKVSLLMAGLPHNVSSLLADKTVSFLRRSARETLTCIPDYEIANALARTAQDSNREIDEEALAIATEAIGGFPYMLQLVGYHAWDQRPESTILDAADFKKGAVIAQEEMTYRVLDSTLQELSPGDIKFAVAMLEDDKDSTIANIASRLGWSSSQVAQYRKRLIEAGVIGQRTRGVVGFDLPFFRQYLQSLVDEGVIDQH